jgi:tetratricopeptide (TPR) repeat protein
MVYSETALDWFALSTTWLGLLWALAAVVSPRVRRGTARVFVVVMRPVGQALAPRAVRVPVNIVLVLLSIGASGAVRYDIRDVDATYREGQTAFQEKRYEDVIRVHSEYVKDDEDRPKIATALLQLGTSYSETNRPELAIETLERLRFDFPNIDYSAQTLFHLAKNYLAIKDEKRAKEYAESLEQQFPDTGWVKRIRKEMPVLLPGPPIAAPAPPPAKPDVAALRQAAIQNSAAAGKPAGAATPPPAP